MQKEMYDYTIKTFLNNINSSDYMVFYDEYESYFKNDGKQDKRRKHFYIKITLKSMRLYDTPKNIEILSTIFAKTAQAMKSVEDRYKNIIFSGITYDGRANLKIRFTTIDKFALDRLTKDLYNFSID